MRTTIAHYPDYRYSLRVYVYVLLFLVLSLHSHSLRYVRIAFLCCASFGCPTFLFICNKFLYNHLYYWAFPSTDTTDTAATTVVVTLPAIVTIIIVACLPFIHCRCCYFLFDFHRIFSCSLALRLGYGASLFFIVVVVVAAHTNNYIQSRQCI